MRLGLSMMPIRDDTGRIVSVFVAALRGGLTALCEAFNPSLALLGKAS
jgi:hypothetical protein